MTRDKIDKSFWISWGRWTGECRGRAATGLVVIVYFSLVDGTGWNAGSTNYEGELPYG